MSFKRYSVFFALFLSLCFMSHPVNAEPVSDNLDDIICDRIYYADKYADLKRAFGYDHDKLLNHWRTYGIFEGRSSSSIYDPQFYINKYGDLKKAFTRNGRVDWAALYNHFKQYGINEGRQASPHFNVSVYKNNYADLRNAFGGTNWRYLKHWREYGMAERRNATTSIGGNNSNNNNNNSSQKRQALQTVPAYTDSALSKRSGNERVDKGDWVTVLRETGNAYYVRYPVSNGTKDRWVSKSIFSSQQSDGNWDAKVGSQLANLNNSAYNASNPFAAKFRRQCTWYAWGRMKEVTGKSITFNGRSYAKAWTNNASNCSQCSLQDNCIAVRDYGGKGKDGFENGHVAFVEHVSGNYVYYTEDNYNSSTNLKLQKTTVSAFKQTYQHFIR